MCLSALIMGTAAYIGEHYVKDQTTSFLSTDASNYSGLYVNADVLGFEGERRLQDEENDAQVVTTSAPVDTTAHKVVDESMATETLHVFRMGYVEFHKGKADLCFDR